MSGDIKIYHGEWWVPAEADPDNDVMFPTIHRGMESRYTGTLTYHEDINSTLELYHVPSKFESKFYGYNDVMWGEDANGNIFTLFKVIIKSKLKNNFDFTNTAFDVGMILLGEHVLSIRDTRYNQCVVQFQYLRNWAFQDSLKDVNYGYVYNHTLMGNNRFIPLLESDIDDSVKWLLRNRFIQDRSKYDLSINQMTEFVIEAKQSVSIGTYLKHVKVFSQFLAIALYCEQSPSEIRLYNKETNRYYLLLFKKGSAVNPNNNKLIKFDELKQHVPDMLKTWHHSYDKISPISSYLIDSLRNKSTFNVPDFLIIAQALDGYHKRFVNKKNGKDDRKYEKQIEILLKQFEDVEAIQKCNINPMVLKDTRHKYSHLYPDDEESLAVEGDELYWLTEKCKILLTCCILNMMGLTNEEINICCENSPISQMIKENSFEFK